MGPPHRVQQPAARLSAYCRCSACWRFARHGVQVVPPSTGGCRPQRMQSPAPIRAIWRRLLLARPARLLASTSAPPYLRPAALPAAYFARSEARLFSRHGSQDERPGAAGAVPHRMHKPASRRSPACRRARLRSAALALAGSRRGFPSARSRASRFRLARLLLSAQGAQIERSGAGARSPHLGQRPAAFRRSTRRRKRSRSFALPTAGSLYATVSSITGGVIGGTPRRVTTLGTRSPGSGPGQAGAGGLQAAGVGPAGRPPRALLSPAACGRRTGPPPPPPRPAGRRGCGAPCR